MFPNIIRHASFATIGTGGLGLILWSSGVLIKPYSYIWKGEIEDPKDISLVCGLAGKKYDCKLSLSLSSVGGGRSIKVTNIDQIFKDSTTRNLYLYDKDKSTWWYIFSGNEGTSWGNREIKISTESRDSSLRPVVKLCQTDSKCASGSSDCCREFKGKTIEEATGDWNKYIKPPKKPVSAENIRWKLSYL